MQPSNISTNAITSDVSQYFEFETEFAPYMECFDMPYTKTTNALDWSISLYPPGVETEHTKDDGERRKESCNREFSMFRKS